MAGTASGVIFTKRGNNHDMELFKGKTVGFSLIWGGGSPINVAGYSASLTIKNPDGTTLTTFTTGNGRVTIGTTDGNISFNMSATDSAALTAITGTYEIEVVDADMNEMLAASGKCEIK